MLSHFHVFNSTQDFHNPSIHTVPFHGFGYQEIILDQPW